MELWAIYAMERDDDVLEYYDQSMRIPLRYRAKSGRNTTQWHTPDFFVIRRDRVGWEEWKPASALSTLAIDMPASYLQDTAGQWRCPPGEHYTEALGLFYQVRSSAEYHPLFIQNLKFLQDYWAHPTDISASHEAQALRVLQQHPGMRLADLLEVCPEVPVDVIWALLSTCRLFTDFSAASLMDHERVCLFLSEHDIGTKEPHHPVSIQLSNPMQPLLWDGRIWFTEHASDLIHLRPELGETLILEISSFEQLVQTGAIQLVSEGTPSPMTSQRRAILLRASPVLYHFST